MWKRRLQIFNFSGFTLVEVLVAMVVLSVGILGLLGALFLSSNVSSRSERLDGAVNLANLKLLQAICISSDKLQPEQGKEDRYSYTLSMENRPGGLMAAKMTVQWLEGGSTQEYTLSRIFSPASARQE